jgi:NADP-dependent 3-hydroxy acid dehydrogenase YdfG
MPQGVRDKVVVITGASNGLGAETARHLSQDGARVVLGVCRLHRLDALARVLGPMPGRLSGRTSPIAIRSRR